MANAANARTGGARMRGDASVGSLASQALSVLVSRRSERPGVMSEHFLAALHRAVCGNDIATRDLVVRDMMDSRIARLDIADIYIPEVARRMGVAWCEDTMSFAEVTIGAARLQGLLRDLTENWSIRSRIGDDALNVVVLVLADDYHTLGPMLVTSQLRRMGASVRLLLGRPLPEIRALVREQTFDAVLVSVAHVEKLALTARLIKSIREDMVRPAPIVVGGPAVELARDVVMLTGADHACNDVREALRLCGLADRTRAQGQNDSGG